MFINRYMLPTTKANIDLGSKLYCGQIRNLTKKNATSSYVLGPTSHQYNRPYRPVESERIERTSVTKVHTMPERTTLEDNREEGITYDLTSVLGGILDKREKLGTRRTPPEVDRGLVDFSSNDYLSLGQSQTLCERVGHILVQDPSGGLGSTGSRLLSGNSELCQDLEQHIARSYGSSSAATLFTSGYTANIGLLSALPQPDTCVVWDADCHNSIREGIRLCRGTNRSFAHNNVQDLRRQLSQVPLGTGIVVVEGIYSMDGSMAPLSAICDIVDEYRANLIVDEAHSLGLFGETGVGLVDSLDLRHRVFATVHPFGKALGFHGAVIVGSNLLIDYLHNYARSFIYTTALPNTSLVAIRLLWDEMVAAKKQRARVADLIALFGDEASAAALRTPHFHYIPSNSPIQALVVGSNHGAISAAAHLKQCGIMTFPIRSPTVAKGTERLRVVLHAHNSEAEVKNLIAAYETFIIDQER